MAGKRHRWVHAYGPHHVESQCTACPLRRLRERGIGDRYSTDGAIWRHENAVPLCLGRPEEKKP